MILLNRYILGRFFINLLLITATFIAIYLLVDFFEKIYNFMEKEQPMGVAIRFFLLNIPMILERLAPVTILLGGVVTLGLLNHGNELIAMKACGISLAKIIRPILWGSLLVTFFYLALAQFLVPPMVSGANKIWNEKILERIPLGIIRNARYYYHNKNAFYSFRSPNAERTQFFDFSYATRDNEDQLTQLISATKATWRDNQWYLHQGQAQTLQPQGQYHTEIFTVRAFALPETPEAFFIPEHSPLELSLTDLYLETQRAKNKEAYTHALTALYGRISYNTLGIPLLLVGLPLLLIVYRRWGRDLSLAVPVSCGLAFFCWGVWGTLQSFAKAGYCDPLLAALGLHVVITGAGIALLIREGR